MWYIKNLSSKWFNRTSHFCHKLSMYLFDKIKLFVFTRISNSLNYKHFIMYDILYFATSYWSIHDHVRSIILPIMFIGFWLTNKDNVQLSKPIHSIDSQLEVHQQQKVLHSHGSYLKTPCVLYSPLYFIISSSFYISELHYKSIFNFSHLYKLKNTFYYILL